MNKLTVHQDNVIQKQQAIPIHEQTVNMIFYLDQQQSRVLRVGKDAYVAPCTKICIMRTAHQP
jgi:hypothetical protein